MDRFGGNLLTLVFENDIISNAQNGMRAVCDHIGIDYHVANFQYSANRKSAKPSLREMKLGYWAPFLRPVIKSFNLGPQYRLVLSASERRQLAELYKDDVLEKLHKMGKFLVI